MHGAEPSPPLLADVFLWRSRPSAEASVGLLLALLRGQGTRFSSQLIANIDDDGDGIQMPRHILIRNRFAQAAIACILV